MLPVFYGVGFCKAMHAVNKPGYFSSTQHPAIISIYSSYSFFRPQSTLERAASTWPLVCGSCWHHLIKRAIMERGPLHHVASGTSRLCADLIQYVGCNHYEEKCAIALAYQDAAVKDSRIH